MPFNKYLIEEKSTLLKNKLEKMSVALATGTSELQTQEQVIAEVIRVVKSFYKKLDAPIFQPEELQEGALPDGDVWNRIWNQILDDLSIVFAELENLETLTLNNFNYVGTEHGRLLARVKNISSSLGDYILYSSNPTRDAFYFKDSFNDLSRIATNSPLLNKPQCEIDQDQGIITLPIDTSKESIIKIDAEPILNSTSNGVPGNNQEIDAAFNGDPKKVLDNNPDTWFEYERVVSVQADTNDPLTLDMTINLGEEKVVNHIRINPNNFGTKTVIEIERIETSVDGKAYINVMDDIPIGDFLTKDEENTFILAPSTSKFAGQGIYSFTPRKAKYVHLVFKQGEPYIIKTPTGDRLRYAIGIRDIDIRGIHYLPEGEIISEAYSFVNDDEIRKAALDTNQNPLEETLLGGIKYFLSPDDGQTWTEFRPKSFEGDANIQASVREIVDFNGSDENTISTPLPVTALRVKAELKRDDSAFTDAVSTFRKEVKSRSELHQAPDVAPFEITLEQPPVDGTLEIIDPNFGSRGRPEFPYIIGQGRSSGAQSSTYYLPFTSFNRVWKKTLVGDTYKIDLAPMDEWFHVSVGGEEWTSAVNTLDSYAANYSTDPEFRLFRFNPNRGTLYFGNGHNTMQPPAGAPITMWMDAERLYPADTTDAHIASLEFKTSNDKVQFDLFRYEEPKTASLVIPKKASLIRLEHKNIYDLGTIPTVLTTLGYTTQVDYFNGKDELTTAVKWCIDEDEGVIYLGTETGASSEYTLNYWYVEEIKLSDDDWEFTTTTSLRDSITIKESAWKTIHVDELILPTTNNAKVIDLAHFGIVRGTVEFDLLSGGDELSDNTIHPLLTEVPFIDGSKEFGATVVRITEKVSSLQINWDGAHDNIAIFDLQHPIVSDVNYGVIFSRPYYFTSKNTNLADGGDWNIDRDVGSPTYRRVFVRLRSVSPVPPLWSTGYITYYYTVPNQTTTGLYSIDYKLGRVYMQRPTLNGSTDAEGDVRSWTLTANYQYTDYRAEYNIARVLPATSYVINRTDRLVKIKDVEVLKRGQIPRSTLGEEKPYYQLTYDYVSVSRESVDELKEYFTPVLKDYVLKVVTKGQLI